MAKEEILHSEMVFHGKFLKIIRDKIKTQSGRTAFREYVLHPGAALVIPVLKDGRLVMERQYRHALKEVFLEFPAGKIDHGETSEEAAQRELMEGTGYRGAEFRFLTRIYPVIGYSNEFIDLYVATGLEFLGQNLDKDEDLTVEIFEFEKLLPWVREGKIADVKTQIALFWYEKILRGEWS
ncbi:MAG: NUDIX hydrolase [Bdellovibrionaceae bacterium]|nr:NUDIX hydrolase [Pseudobdellovibrionaceae bacterium]